MNRRGFVTTVLGAITAGLSRPWWERGMEPHTIGSFGVAPPGTIATVNAQAWVLQDGRLYLLSIPQSDLEFVRGDQWPDAVRHERSLRVLEVVEQSRWT